MSLQAFTLAKIKMCVCVHVRVHEYVHIYAHSVRYMTVHAKLTVRMQASL